MADSCRCGSGLPRFDLFDARRIFLTFARDRCERDKLSRYRPEVLTDAAYHTDEAIDED